MSAAARTGGRWRPVSFGLLGDERLAQRVGNGDERAFAVVYERYHQILYRYCRSILRNDADAQDALQSTFAAAFAALRAGQRDAPMRPWLFRIAHNESVSLLRRRRPAAELSAASEYGATSIEEQVAERAKFSLLLHDLRELTDRQRSALVLRELSGLSHQEIAVALGTSVGGAKQTIFEARQSLFEFAEGRAMACDEIRKTISDADGRAMRSRRVRAHLRDCGGCAAFAAAIPARTGELRALAPALPAAAASGLFGRIALSSGAHNGGAGVAPLVAGAAKTGIAGAGFGANALAGVAVVATATVGVTVGVGKLVQANTQVHPARAGAAPAARAPARHPASPSSAVSGSPVSGNARSGRVRATGRSAANQPSQATLRTSAATPRHHGRSSHTAGSGRPAWAQVPGSSAGHGSSATTQHGNSGAHSGTTSTGHTGHGKPTWAAPGKPSSPGSSTSAKSGKSGSTGSSTNTSRVKAARTAPGKPPSSASGKSAPTRSGKSATTKLAPAASPLAVGVEVNPASTPAPGSAKALGAGH